MSFGREIGKRVGGALYVHRDAIVPISQTAERVRAAEQLAGDTAWNVAKIEKISVSLLQYESFDHDFPALLSATTVNLQSGSIKRTDYRGRHSPPILHRKELLLAPTDARLPRFRALTATAEEYGLFRDATKIGTRALWNAKLAAAGLTLREGRLVRADEEALQIARHRTAIIRRDLSQPMQLLMRAGIMSEQQSLFDYGCGQGEDVAALTAQGFNAFGWDPHHAPDGPRRPAAIVNLGFVLNVIEDSHERIETLKTAWQFAERALCVSVMVRGRVSTAGHRPYRDGFRTSRGTFQKYFDQQELRAFVAHATGQLPIALAPGIVATFRDKELEQEVLFRLRSRTFVGGALPRPPARARISVVRPTLRERLAPVLDQLRTLATRVGRLPELFEVPAPVQDELSAARVSWTRTIEALEQCLDGDADFEPAFPKWRGV